MNDVVSSSRIRVAATIAIGALYLHCLAPTVHVHDAGELTAAAWTLGLGHPPGSPLYMLLAKSFMVFVPFGHIAWRANLLSAVFAVGLFIVLAWWAERRGQGPIGAIVTGLVAALTPVLWSQAVMAEVYTLEALLLAAVLASFDLETRPEITALLWGLLLACHVGPAPLTPVLLLLLALRGEDRNERLRILVRSGFAVALPLLLYVYVPLRAAAGPAIDWGSPRTLRELWWYLSNANVRARSFSLPAAAYLGRAVEFAGILVRNFHLALPVAVLGLIVSRRRRTVILAAAVVLFDAAFVVLLDTAPLASEAYGIPSVVAVAVLTGLGLEVLRERARVRSLVIVLLVSGMVISSWSARGTLDLSRSFVVRDTAEAVLDQAPTGAVLFTQEDNTTFPLAYLVAVEGARPDLEIFDRAGNLFASPYDRPLHRVEGDLGAFRKAQEEPLVEGLLAAGRTVVFTSQFLEYQPETWSLRPCGTVARAGLPGHENVGVCPQPPPPRRPKHPDWMSRQILAMDGVRRAASDLAENRPVSAVNRLDEALAFSDLAGIDLRIAQLALEANDPGIAGRAAERALDRRPDSAATVMIAARAAVAQGRWDRAEVLFDRTLVLEPRRVEALIDRALVRERRGEIGAAVADLREAAALHDAGPAPLLLLRVLVRSGAARNEIVESLCALTNKFPADALETDVLTEVLLAAARAGAPGCVERWLEESAGDGAEQMSVIAAYREATRGGGER